MDSRHIIIVPAANALGYAQETRAEGNVDPNRDFAWDVTAADKCMQVWVWVWVWVWVCI